MFLAAITLVLTVGVQQTADPSTGSGRAALNEELWAAARAGDVARVTKALDQGADVTAGNRYKATALFFAADRGHTEVIKGLLDRGADINAVDTFYKFRPIMLEHQNYGGGVVVHRRRSSRPVGRIRRTGWHGRTSRAHVAARHAEFPTARRECGTGLPCGWHGALGRSPAGCRGSSQACHACAGAADLRDQTDGGR